MLHCIKYGCSLPRLDAQLVHIVLSKEVIYIWASDAFPVRDGPSPSLSVLAGVWVVERYQCQWRKPKQSINVLLQ